MTIKDTLKADLTKFLKERNELGKTTLRGVLGAVETAEKSGKTAVEFTDSQVLELLGREVKKRRETATIYAGAGQVERSERETAEADLIAKYLPAQLDREAIETFVDNAVAELGAAANMGKVMKLVTPFTKGRADGKLVSEIVRSKLDV
jgi:uncharacterized protein YqeY